MLQATMWGNVISNVESSLYRFGVRLSIQVGKRIEYEKISWIF